MKELSTEEKAKAYDEAIEKARQLCDYPTTKPFISDLQDIFPELAESEDNEDLNILQRFSFYSYKDEPNILYLSGLYVAEEYRNKGIGTKILEVADTVAKSLDCRAIRLKAKKNSDAERLYQTHGYNSLAIEGRDEIWLEKQGEQKYTAEEVLIKAGLKPYKDGDQWCVLLGDNIQEGICGFGNTIEDALYAFLEDLIASQGEQKSADKFEPKFKVGDWVVFNNKHQSIYQVEKIEDGYYILRHTHGGTFRVCVLHDESLRLWSIKDAKDGDVLCSGQIIVIFKHFEDPSYRQSIVAYIGLDAIGNVQITDDTWTLGIDKVKPATKEQRDTLLKAMTDAGYTFDFEKKELKKVEQKPTEEYNITGIGSKHAQGKLGEMIKNLKPINKVLVQKSIDKVEPKFKIEKGKWYVGIKTLALRGKLLIRENNIYYAREDGAVIGENESLFIDKHDGNASEFLKLWTIQNAKDGDVLCCESGWTCIFKALDNNTNTFSSYCFMDNTKWFCETGCECHTLDKAFIKAYNGEIYPATKEQCDILFQKMKEAGYEWDAEKKELKKIEQKPWSEEDIATISRVISIVKWAAYSDHSHPILNDKGATELVERLESLKDRLQLQSTWKPSDEQMDALRYVTNFDYGGHKAILVSLYEQLKNYK